MLAQRREREDRPVMKEDDVRIEDCGGIMSQKIKRGGLMIASSVSKFLDWNAGVAMVAIHSGIEDRSQRRKGINSHVNRTRHCQSVMYS